MARPSPHPPTLLGASLVLGLLLAPSGVARGEVWGVAQARYGLNVQPNALGCGESPCARLDGVHSLDLGSRVPGEVGLYGQLSLSYTLFGVGDVPQRAIDTFGPYGDLKVYGLALGYQRPKGGLELSAGRQGRWDADPVVFDGLSVTLAPRALSSSLKVSLWGGSYVDLGADVWAARLYGALFPQDAEGLKLAEGEAVYGLAASLRPTQRTLVELSDTHLLNRHHTRLAVQERLGPLTLGAGARTLDLDFRDAWVSLTHLHAPRAQVGGVTLTRGGAQPFALGPADGISAAVDRLRIGDLKPHWRLEGLHQRPLGPLVLDASASALWLTDAASAEAFQRDTLYGRLGLSWGRGGWQLSGSTYRLVQPGVEGGDADSGDAQGGAPLPEDRAEEPPLFADLSGEGVARLTGVDGALRYRVGPALRAELRGGLVVIGAYTTQFLSIEAWEAFSVTGSCRWQPTPWLSLDAATGFERDLQEAFGISQMHRRASLALTARW